MEQHCRDLLAISRLLLDRGRIGGPPTSAHIRRSISTTYYALFQFLLDECALRIVGSSDRLLIRRRVVGRQVTHRGAKEALRKALGQRWSKDIERYLGDDVGPSIPSFMAQVARMFGVAQSQRHSADYDLNADLIELDATVLIEEVEGAIKAWIAADQPADEDLKDAMCLLILLGRLRADEG